MIYDTLLDIVGMIDGSNSTIQALGSINAIRMANGVFSN